MIDDIKIEPLNLDGLVEPLPSTSRPTTPHLPALLSFLQEKGLTPGSTTGGRHNLNSRHYTGNAVDIKGSGGFSDAQVSALAQEAASRGFRLRDERTRPARQAVWGGPHVHLEYAGMPTTDNLNLDGLVEPLNVEGLTESIVPPVPMQLSTDDTEWHFGENISNPSPRAARVLREAVTEDERKKKLYGHVDPPDIGYQNRMREKAGLKPLQVGPTIRAAGTQDNRPFGGNLLMPTIDRAQAFADDAARKKTEAEYADSSRKALRNISQMTGSAFQLLPNAAQDWINEALAGGTASLINTAAGIIRYSPHDPLSDPQGTKKLADKLLQASGEISGASQSMAKTSGRGIVSQTLNDLTAGTIGSSPSLALMALGVPASVAFGLQAAAESAGQDKEFRDILTDTTKAATIGALFDIPVPAKLSLLRQVGARVAPISAVSFGLDKLSGGDTKHAAINALINGAFAASGLGRHEIIPDVPRGERPLGVMPEIPDVPVGTISEPRLIRGVKRNADEIGQVESNNEAELRGIRTGENLPAHRGEVRQEAGGRTASGGGVETSGQVKQEDPLNLTGLIEPASETDPLAQSATSTPASVSPQREAASPKTASTSSAEATDVPSSSKSPESSARSAQGEYPFAVLSATNPLDATVNFRNAAGEIVRRRISADNEADLESALREQYGLERDAQRPGIFEAAKAADATTLQEATSSPVASTSESAEVSAPKTTETAITPELQKFADQATAVRAKATDNLTAFERAAIERKASRLEAKARGEELRHAGVDPSELLDDIIIRGGELIREGKASFDEWAKKLREELGPEASAHLKNVWAQLTSPVPDVPRLEDTGIKHAIVEAERELQGLPQFARARRAHGQSFDEGVYDVQSGRIKPRELASDIVRAFYDPKFSMERFQSRRPRPLSTEESMALLYDRMRISNERKAAETELEAANESGDASRAEKALDEVSRLQQASNANDEADYVAGGEQARGLAIRRELIKDDYSRARVLSQALALNKGKPLPAHITAALEEKVAELVKANDRIAELESRQQAAGAHSEIEKVIEKTQREVRTQARQRNRQVLDTEAASIKDQIAAAWKRTHSGIQPSGLAGLDPEGELTKLLGMLARNRVEAGISKAADLVDAVHEMVKDVADLTKRDVQDLISGYSKTSKPQQDEIGAKLSELKAIMRVSSGKADVVEKGIRPLRSGFQRPKQTQELREALRDLRDTLREHGIKIEQSARSPEDQQKSILDAAKTATRNRIEDLTKWIADGKRTVASKTELIPDAELKTLRAERDKLQTVFDAIDDPEADQKTITRALGAANKSILDLESKIKSGEVQPKAKGAQPTSPELEAARRAQKTLQDILRDMRTAERRANKPAEDPIVTEARKVLAAQKAFMARNQKQMVEMRKELAEANRIAKEGGARPEKTKRTPTPQTDEMRVAQRNANQLRRDIDSVYSVIDWANKTKIQKGFAYAAAGVRAGVLSGVKVLGKIGGALVQRIGQQYIEEPIGAALSKVVPGSEKAPRHGGGMSAAAEADYLRGLASGAMEIPSILKTGESELSLERGKRYPNIPTKLGTALSLPGRVHAAEKNPLKVAEYNRSLERNFQWAERQGMDRSNPDVIEQAKARAFKDADEVVLLGDNPITRSLTNMQRGWKDESRSLFKMVVPVAKVPSNYLSQAVGDYGLGLVRGGLRAIRQRNPELLEKLTPEEADKTMRLLKRGSLGLIYMALAGSGAGGAITAGGFWSKKKKGERRTVEPGDIQIGPATISHLWLHSPPDELAQFAGTIRREIENKAARRESVVKRAATGAAVSAKGTLDQVPFLSRYTRVYDSFRTGDALLKMAGDTVADWVEPQIVQELAKATDREEKGRPTVIPWKGEAVQRKAKTFGESFLVGLPGGRQYLKKDRKKMMEMRQQERRGGVVPPVPGALNLNGLVEPSPSPTP